MNYKISALLGFVTLLASLALPTAAQAANHPVYTNSLASGWENWSWGSTVSFNNSIEWTPTNGYGGLYLHKNGGINTAGYSHLKFRAQSSQTGDILSVLAYNASDGAMGDQVLLQNYGGNPIVGSFKEYSIPLADLSATNKVMNGFHIQNQTGKSRPKILIDDIELVASGNPTPTPSTTPSPTPNPTATPIPSTTPTPSPSITPTPSPSPSTTPSPSPTATPTIVPSPTPSPLPGGFNRPLVSLTFDDGSQTQYTNGWPLLQQYGMKGTFYITTQSLDGYWYMTESQVKSLFNAGNEIAAHTISHRDLATLGNRQLDKELSEPQAYLENLLQTSIPNFATPFGSYNSKVITYIKKYYATHRSVDEGFNTKSNFNPYNIMVQNAENSTSTAQINAWVQEAQQKNSWLVLVYHEIKSNPSQYDTSTQMFNSHLQTIKATGVKVLTLQQALNELLPQL